MLIPTIFVSHFGRQAEEKRIKQRLHSRFKESRLLKIFNRIIDSYEDSQGKGIPIGNLSSQYFANFYLAKSDRYLKEKLQAPAYVRYMDDMVIWTNNKEQLLSIGKSFEQYITENLKLELKPFCLNKTDKGLPFLGYLLYPHQIRLLQASRDRLYTKFKLYTEKLNNNEWTQTDYQRHILPLFAFSKHADSFALRKKILTNFQSK